MDKRILECYRSMRNQYVDLQRRISNLEDKITKAENEGIVSDIVANGKKGKKALGTTKIEGIRDVSHYKTKLLELKWHYVTLEEDMLDQMIEVEEFIENCQDRTTQEILRYRYLDGMQWNEVAFYLGNDNTEDSVRKRAERYLRKEEE